MQNKKTKIVTTIGPSSDSAEKMEELMRAGANVFRFNMKHATVEWHEERIKLADSIAKKIGHTLGILIDLQGPEIRLETKDKAEISVAKDEVVEFHSTFKDDSVVFCLPHASIFDILNAGDELLIDDGFMEFDIQKVTPDLIVAKSRDDYRVKNRKGVNFPGKDIDLPSLIDPDLKKLDMATKNKVDFVALSFARRKKDIDILRAEMDKRGVTAAVIAKIESQQSIDNFDEVLTASDGIMIGRGDLGVEIPIEQLAYWQKQIVHKCRLAGKPVIVATQMLQSMTENPRPTRAEATDVANAVWDGTDAVMLSGETAFGKYPIKSVEAMAKIAEYNETKAVIPQLDFSSDTSTKAVVSAAAMFKPSVYLIFTESGYTARLLSSYRPDARIIAVTKNHKVVEELSLSYGVQGVVDSQPNTDFHLDKQLLAHLKAQKLINSGEQMLVIHGQHGQIAGSTNSLLLTVVE